MNNDCPTCLAMVFDEMTIELGHCAGVAMGVALAGACPDPKEARAFVEKHFCEEHAALIFGAARSIADTAKRSSG